MPLTGETHQERFSGYAFCPRKAAFQEKETAILGLN